MSQPNYLTLVTKTGIVNVFDIIPNRSENFLQLIWNGEISFVVRNMNPEILGSLKNTKHCTPITEYSAVYFNGVRLVTNGKLTK